jgi:hypothetical protein
MPGRTYWAMGSRLLPLALATAALLAGAAGLGGLALWLGLLTVPVAAAAAFVSVSDVLEGRPGLLTAVTSVIALALLVLASAARENAATGAPMPRLVSGALVAALLAYAVPAVAWVLQPVRLPRRTSPQRHLRASEVEELLSRAA